MSALPLPASTARLIESVPLSARHPGLQLDKYIRPCPKQELQKESLHDVCHTRGDPALLAQLWERRQRQLDSLASESFEMETAGPLTLHLARASALENAGICLHPVYGFVYLPGSGLKGMARAYAIGVWWPSRFQAGADGRPVNPQEQEKAQAAWAQIEAVFGRGPGDKLPDALLPPRDESKRDRQQDDKKKIEPSTAGGVVFHDAWPTQWPQLELDLVNNHHTKYYREEGREPQPPGDWEAPVMISFLIVGAGNRFRFHLSKRVADIELSESPPDLLKLAGRWLKGALAHEGAGAKTAAGYGSFRACNGMTVPALVSPKRHVAEAELELVSPAFLAGPHQRREDCALRAATLRGLLRWWWRTMHAGFVNTRVLRRLEAAVWGDTESAGAVRLDIATQAQLQPVPYDYKDRFQPKADFARAHQLAQPPNRKTTQGLFYMSYGMDDGGRRRWYLPAGSTWQLRLIARPSSFPSGSSEQAVLSPELLVTQAQAALALLCMFGGAGSKSRKGFGSFRDLPGWSFEECVKAAADFRKQAGCEQPVFQEAWVQSPALAQMNQLGGPLLLPTAWEDPWYALDQLGFAYQEFAQSYAHREQKRGLGLPRKIHGPRREPLRGQDRASHRPPKTLYGNRKGMDRHASPVLFHLGRGAAGAPLELRVTMFPAPALTDLAESKRLLGELRQHLDSCLRGPASQQPAMPSPGPQRRQPTAGRSAASSAPPPARLAGKRPAGTAATVTIVGPREVKGQPKARSRLEQAGPGDEPITRLPTLPTFLLPARWLRGALCTDEACWQRG